MDYITTIAQNASLDKTHAADNWLSLPVYANPNLC